MDGSADGGNKDIIAIDRRIKDRFGEFAFPYLSSVGCGESRDGPTRIDAEDGIAIEGRGDPFWFTDPIASDEFAPNDLSGGNFQSYNGAFDSQDSDFISDGIDLVANAT